MKRKRIIISTISIITLFTFIIIFILIRNRSIANDIIFNSENYDIQAGFITNISPNTSIELFNKYFDISNCSISVTNENDEILTSGFIYTGSKTKVYNLSNNLIGSYTNIVTGDISYDGIVSIDDTNALATYLVKENNLDDYQKKAIDINKDNKVKINDLTLLESYLDSNYQSLTFSKDEIEMMSGEQKRLVPTITPSIVLNQNLNWTSSNTDVIEVDESGKITANNEGESIITATTKDGLKFDTIRIVVDNTPKLPEENLTIYTGTKLTYLDIQAIDYPNLTCTSTNENAATCSIENKQLIITPTHEGSTQISVTSPYYGSAQLNITTREVIYHISPQAYCLGPNQSQGFGYITGFNFGTVSFKSIDDTEIVRRAYAYPNGISVETGAKCGDTNLTYIESNGNNETIVKIYVYKLKLSQTSGTTTIGTNLTANIETDNAGELTCQSSNTAIATCSIENNQLTIVPVSTGNTTVMVYGSHCGSVPYNVTINEATPEPDPEEEVGS